MFEVIKLLSKVEVNIARNWRLRKTLKYYGSIMLHILEIYWKPEWRNGGRWSCFPTMCPMFEIVITRLATKTLQVQ